MSNQASSLFERLIPKTLLALACQVLLLLLVVAFTTFFISNASYTSTLSNNKDNVRKVAVTPYWLPYFGHLSLVFDRTSKLQRGRRNSPSGIFALKLFGTKYNIVWTPSLIDAAFNNHHASLNSIEPRWTLLRNVFGADGRSKDEYVQLYMDDQVCLLDAHLIKGSFQTAEPTVHAIEQHTPNLLSFAERPIDQNPWEQNVNPVFHDPSLVEVSFFELISRFVAHVSLPTVVGTEFLETHPTTVEDLWDFDGGFTWLKWGFSRLWGIPSLTRAHIARRRLLTALESFHKAADTVSNGDEAKEPWREIGDLTEVMKERREEVWNTFQTSPGIRAALDLNLLWAMSTKSASLVFWMLLHIHTDPTLLTQIRAEIAHSVIITQPPRVLSIPSPPRLFIASSLLIDHPLLRSCLYECLRLYTTPTSTRFVNKDTIIRDPNGKVQSHQDYVLDSGSYIIAPLALLHHNPRYFWQPNEFQPRRFIRAKEDENPTKHTKNLNKTDTTQVPPESYKPSTLHPFGIGHSDCPARFYAEREILTFVAAILALWEFEPANPDKGWLIPDQREREIVSVPKWDPRVKVRARELSSS